MPSIQLKTKIPGPKSQALFAERQAAVPRGPFHGTPAFVTRAKGALLEDIDGNTFIDLASGIGVLNVGHMAPEIVQAIHAQADQALHLSFNVTPYEGYVRLAQKLNEATPGNFSKKTFLVTTGAEAVENAIKIARAYTKRQAIVCFDHAFHGRTYMAMSLTSKVKPYRQDFGPFNPEIYRVPYPYPYRGVSADEAFKRFEDVVNTQVGVTHTAAVILEPVQGEGGFLSAPKEFLQKLRDYCTANKIVLIADEIQSGFGRTGAMFACDHAGIAPDLITTAKGLGGGMPVAAVTGRAEIMDAPLEGGIGGTYNGNPVACAAALAVFDLLEDGKIIAHAKKVGEALRNKLAGFAERYPTVGDVRGVGPMLALELVKDKASKEPHPDGTKQLIKHCFERGVIMLSAGTYGNVIRFLPPLVIETAQLEEALAVVESGLKELR